MVASKTNLLILLKRVFYVFNTLIFRGWKRNMAVILNTAENLRSIVMMLHIQDITEVAVNGDMQKLKLCSTCFIANIRCNSRYVISSASNISKQVPDKSILFT